MADMNTRTLLVIGAIVVIFAFLGGIALQESRGDVDNPTPTPSASESVSPSPSATPTPSPAPVTHTIRRNDTGVSPKTLTVRRGDTVVFINDATSGFWPASDPHTHTAV